MRVNAVHFWQHPNEVHDASVSSKDAYICMLPERYISRQVSDTLRDYWVKFMTYVLETGGGGGGLGCDTRPATPCEEWTGEVRTL